MSCDKSLIKDIISNCTTAANGGLEVNAYIGKRTDLDITFSSVSGKENVITDVSNKVGKKCIKITGIKKLLKAGHTGVFAENRPNKFTHTFSLEVFELLAADFLNMDQPDDAVVFVELKDKTATGEGVFIALGAKAGLYASADTWDSSANNGARMITLSSIGGQEEQYSRYVVFDTDYATTAALVAGLTTVGA